METEEETREKLENDAATKRLAQVGLVTRSQTLLFLRAKGKGGSGQLTLSCFVLLIQPAG